MKVVKRVNPKSSHYKEKISSSYLALYLCEIRDVHLFWSSFHDICKLDHYAEHLKFTQCCMSMISQ